MKFQFSKNRNFVVLAGLGTLLAGCGSAPPQVINQTKTVEVPVAVPCKVKAVEKPAWALGQVDPRADVYVKGRAALVEVRQRAAYEILLEAAAAACR
ncbi:hypothetical protein ACKI2N_002070 [Cupriavidus sp. 30B13]|uniref:hypothetical protein n=1 Tax=Cupriavidus sp. 30B13 TaxID=3384241 RepID=UPI003B8FFF1E